MLNKKFFPRVASLALFVSVVAFMMGKLDAVGKEANEYRIKYNNQLAAADSLEGVVGGYEILAFQHTSLIDSLGHINEDLAKTIDGRNEEVLSLTRANIKLKDLLLEATEGDGSASDSVVVDTTTGENRFRVDFRSKYGIMNVYGHTLTNPAEANVRVSWDRPLELTTIMSRGEDGRWHGYMSSPDSLILPTDLDVRIDESLFDPAHRPWYRRFIGGVGTTGTGVFGTFSWENGNNMYGAIYENRKIDDVPYSGFGFLYQRRF